MSTGIPKKALRNQEPEPAAPETQVARKRRAPGEVERLIIEAALEVFAAKGYAGATTREIAAVARVHEPMVYRRFGSKVKLFEATVLAPFNELISTYLDTYPTQPDPSDTLEVLAQRFIEPFYDQLQERRDLLLALLAASQFHEDFADQESITFKGFGRLVERLERQLELEARRHPFHAVDVAAVLRVSIGMILGVALLGDWIQAVDDPVGRNRLVDEMVRLSVHGIIRSDPGEPADDDRVTVRTDTGELTELLDRAADAERRATRAELELELLRRRQHGQADRG
jgi:AcrR family transcriptional regulator